MSALEALSYDAQLAALNGFVARMADDGDPAVAQTRMLWLSLAESVKAARDHNLNCHALATPLDLRVDPIRATAEVKYPETGLAVRARNGDAWGAFDLVLLDRRSVVAWLRSRGGHNEWAEAVVLILLGHEVKS